MKFKFIVSKWANFYFFASNLSGWHFSCRKDYNNEWVEKIGSLTEKESKVIKEFKKIKQRYGFELDKYFYLYNEKQAWRKLGKFVKKLEFEKIKFAFKVLTPRFEKIWKTGELKNRVIIFKKILNQGNYQNLINDLKSFFYNKNIKEFNVIAILSPLRGKGVTAAGGANIGGANIILETPKLKQNSWEFEYSIGILFHEIAHLLFNRINGTKMIQGVIKELKLSPKTKINIQPRVSVSELINELVIESLLPCGYLSWKHFKLFKPFEIAYSKSNLRIIGENLQSLKQNKPSSLVKLRKLIIWQLYPLTAFYIETKKKINAEYLKEIVGAAKILTK